MRLICHPDSGNTPASAIDTQAARDGSALTLMYTVRGDIKRVSLPEPLAPARADDLWRHTCFEAFVRTAASLNYWEFNFSPSRQWAAYRFDRYREGMAVEWRVPDPRIEAQGKDGELRLSAVLELAGIPALQGTDVWQLGLSAIVEDENGGKSWWALAHPSGKPDFHHPDSFVLEV